MLTPRPLQPYALLMLNSIARQGLDILADQCTVYENNLKDPHAILVRSTKVDTDDYEADLLAIARAGVGYDNITVDKATERGIPVFFAPGANANSVKELVFASLGIAARNLHRSQQFLQGIDTELPNSEIDKLVEAGKKKFSGFELLGKKFGVIGMGNIGRLVAKTALALGMEVVAYDPHLTPDQWEESVDPGVKRVAGIFQLFKRANIVSVHVTSTDETRNLINDGNMADMHDGTILINMSREPVCNEKD
ncbi:3-phosphoglycerate dehydrogenase, partial [Candidatus Kaiserbacteria bacterium]|nr:3-phosphoglycerate dehydrogenase [Candidatus Kaiserbacteria bacterium]